MQDAAWGEQRRQGLQAGLGIVEVMQHPNAVDVLKGSFTCQVQQAALLKTHRGLLDGA